MPTRTHRQLHQVIFFLVTVSFVAASAFLTVGKRDFKSFLALCGA
jgi:hypothetical protein